MQRVGRLRFTFNSSTMQDSRLPADGLEGLRRHWAADATSGFTVFLLALPLSLGIASASGFPPAMGLVTAILGGLLGAFLSGSALAIKGPAAGLIVIVAGAVTDFGGGTLGWQLTLGVLVASGLLQTAFGLLRWGRLVDLFPLAAVHGMLAAIGLIILAKQAPVLLGVSSDLTAGKGPLELLASLPRFVAAADPMVALIGGISLALALGWPALKHRFARRIPAPLLVLAAAIPLGAALELGPDCLVVIGRFTESVGIHVDFSGWTQAGTFLKYLAMFALVGSLESLLTVKAVDALDPWRRTSDPNRDLVAIGVANTVAAVFGGLPMISEVARSSANAANGGVTRWSNFFHGLFLLAAALFAVGLLERIPSAALAALLVGVGVRLAHPRELIAAYRIGPEQLAIFLTTVFFTLYEDLLVGIAAGMAVKFMVHLFRGASPRELLRSDIAVYSNGPETTIHLRGAAVFSNILGTKAALGKVTHDVQLRGSGHTVVLDVLELRLIDHSAMEALHHFQEEMERGGAHVDWVGLEALVARSDHPLAARRLRPKRAWTPPPPTAEAPADVEATLCALAHVLPAQPALRDFVHHNTLHGYQDRPFFEAIFAAERAFDVRVVLPLEDYRTLYRTGRIADRDVARAIRERYGAGAVEVWAGRMHHGMYAERPAAGPDRLRNRWKSCYAFDLDAAVQPRLFRLVGAYLDQGVAIDLFPDRGEGLLAGVRGLERTSRVSLFTTRRVRSLLHDPSVTVEQLLGLVVGKQAWFHAYLCEQQLAHRGYSGLVATVERMPETLLDRRDITLRDWVHLELLLEIDALDAAFGMHWEPIALGATKPPYDPLATAALGEREEVLALWQAAFEGHFHDDVLAAVEVSSAAPVHSDAPAFTAICCIDDREDSLRRHLEREEPACTTFGAPGFFGVPVFFRPLGGRFTEKLAPVPVTPRHLIRETEHGHRKGRRALVSTATLTPLRGLATTLGLGAWSAAQLVLDVFSPRRRPDNADAFAHMAMDGTLQLLAADPPEVENGLQVGFTPEEMAEHVFALLRNIGLFAPFAPVVFVVGHGSSSANNPHHAAYDCGACSGRPGGVNARIFAALANRADVRERLRSRGLDLPDTTWFVGALHDTASDVLRCYDEGEIPASVRPAFEQARAAFERALDRNAVERSRRFVAVDSGRAPAKVRRAVAARSETYAEPRPELGHGSNALCIVGRRSRFKSVFFDRRAFHQSYDALTDPEGRALQAVLAPLPVVCGGICLEYYFSRMDNAALGAGTKLSHHVIGLFAVSHSADGDLRPGLPLQMVEIHDPMRLLLVLEHDVAVIDRVLEALPDQRAWFALEWVRLVAAPPGGGLYRFCPDGSWEAYRPESAVRYTSEPLAGIDGEPPIASMHIAEATRENLPIAVVTSVEPLMHA